jgi:hypothetical protein
VVMALLGDMKEVIYIFILQNAVWWDHHSNWQD